MAGSGRGGRLAAWGLGLAGAAAVGLWQGIGTGIAEKALGWFDPPVTETQKSRREDEASTLSEPTGEKSKMRQREDLQKNEALTVRQRTRLSVSAVGSGPVELRACGAAVRNLAEEVERQCDRIVLEQGGISRRIEELENECGTCAVSGRSWRCVAHSEPICVILGGEDREATQ